LMLEVKKKKVGPLYIPRAFDRRQKVWGKGEEHLLDWGSRGVSPIS